MRRQSGRKVDPVDLTRKRLQAQGESLTAIEEEIEHEIEDIAGQLDNFFDESETDTVGTRFGTVRRDKDNIKNKWTLITE